jgi:SNF2 family DNA or RNA helicase
MVGIPPATPGLSRSSTPASNSEGSQHATEGPMRGVKASPSVNTPGNDKNQAKPQTRVRGEPSDATIARWRKGDFDLEPSVKMLALIKLLQEWNASGDKCICFSQCSYFPSRDRFRNVIIGYDIGTSMLDLVEILFSRYGIRSLRYDGRMDRTARDSTLATFRKPGGPKVILIRQVKSPPLSLADR